jgi:hypothetical protein
MKTPLRGKTTLWRDEDSSPEQSPRGAQQSTS